MSRDLLGRVRWGNLARAAAAAGLLAVVIAWPRLAADPPALPPDAATPLATPVPAASPARSRGKRPRSRHRQRKYTPPERRHTARRPKTPSAVRHRPALAKGRPRPKATALAAPPPPEPPPQPTSRPTPRATGPTPVPPRFDAALREFGFDAG